MLNRLHLKFRRRRLERRGFDLGIQFLELANRIQALHPESLERELLMREAGILDRMILENGEELQKIQVKLNQF